MNQRPSSLGTASELGAGTRYDRLVALLALGWAAVAVLYIFSFRPLKAPILTDNQHYFFIAERAASGVPPHISFFGPKTQLTTLVTGAAISAGRLAGVDDLVATRLLSILVTASSVSLAFLVTARLNRSLLSGHCAALAMMALGGFMSMGAMGARPKVFMVPFLLLTIWWVLRPRPFAAGTATGLAFLCWQVTAVVSAGSVAALLLVRRPLRAVLLFAAGVLVVSLPYLAYFIIQGALPQMVEQSLVYPSRYMSHGLSLSKIATTGSWFLGLGRGLSSRTVLPGALLLSLAAAWLFALVQPRATLARVRGHPVLLALLLGATAAVFFTLQDYQGFPDRFLAEPFMAVTAGSIAAGMASRLGRRRTRLTRALVATAAVVLMILLVWRHPLPRYGKRLASQRELAADVARLVDQNLSVYAIGCTHLLGFAHLDNHVPFGLGFRGMREYMRTTFGEAPWQPLREGRLPDVVLHSRGPIPGGNRWLEKNYEEIERADYRQHRIRLYVLRGSRAVVIDGIAGLVTTREPT